MFSFQRTASLAVLLLGGSLSLQAQEGASVALSVSDGNAPVPSATVELLSGNDSVLVKVGVTDASGLVRFDKLPARRYFFRATHTAFGPGRTEPFTLAPGEPQRPVTLRMPPASGTLAGVTVTARRPFLEQKPGKTVVNLENSITTVGSTVAEALERLPGVNMDRDGNISLKGRNGILVYIDGKPTNLSGTELATMLQGMSASNISQIELLDQPPARYEAAGGAGIINIITKKTRLKGFNGSFTTAFSMGRYPKSNNSVQVAVRQGPWSINASYSLNANKNYMQIEALRKYYDASGNVRSQLDQPSLTRNAGITHSLRSAVDYAISQRTTIGATFNGLYLERTNWIDNHADWKNAQGVRDSALVTMGETGSTFSNVGTGLNLRHNFTANKQFSIDLDRQWYRPRNRQYFENGSVMPVAYTEAYRSYAPGSLQLLTARADYSARTKSWSFETGARIADTRTDNEVIYEANTGGGWNEDLGRSNHFVYHEEIKALYGSAELKAGKWSLQGGMRFEATAYNARQLGNRVVKDSSFSRSYESLFPTLLISLEADSNHSWSFSAGRRIDRPAFHKLNPFSFIINKYTVQRGNPFFRPQYSWNMEVGHTYKSWLLTSVGYSITTDYFAQLFPVDPNGLVVYTEGNLGKLQVLSLNIGMQRNPFKWWSFSANVQLQQKWQEGFVERAYTEKIRQGTFNMTNTFRFGKGWTGELAGVYISRSQIDIQEILDPSGQFNVGIAKTVLKGAGTLKLAGRDLFHTQWIKGNTVFKGVTEWFKLSRDTRVATVSFSWRFGKAFKQARRNVVNEEAQRVGSGS
ncbi:MAG: TonB-dependent receptor [Chitinophagaceae bacterium]|nr:MAG: TonB-dependent receptor [Chitinophagaceae bacterium]